MDRFLIFSLTVVSLVLHTAVAKTNFVIVVADDMGYGDVGYNGGVARTPVLDAMASSGILLQSMHSSFMCAPSRAMIMTGLHPERSCVSGFQTTFRVPSDMTTLGNDAQGAGYRTSFFGKFHLTTINNNELSTRFGFDTWTASQGNLVAFNSSCFCPDLDCGKRNKAQCRPAEICSFRRSGCFSTAISQCYTGFMSKENLRTKVRASHECSYLTNQVSSGIQPIYPEGPHFAACDVLVTQFEKFVNSVDKSRPLLAVIAFTETHIPYIQQPDLMTETARALNIRPNTPRAHYVTALEAIDRAVGSIKSILSRANRLDNTFLLFVSDNGPEKVQQGGAGSSGVLRGTKRTLWEGGIRVPAILEWPSVVERNAVSTKGVVSLLDIRATVRDVILQEGNKSIGFMPKELDGLSLLPLITNPTTWRRNSEIYICSPAPDKATLRICPALAIFRGDMKALGERFRNKIKTTSSVRSSLFNLSKDISEKNNLVIKNSRIYKDMMAAGKKFGNDLELYYKTNKCPPLKRSALPGKTG